MEKREICGTSKIFATLFCGTVVVLELHGCIAASWSDDLDEEKSMSDYILTPRKRYSFSEIEKIELSRSIKNRIQEYNPTIQMAFRLDLIMDFLSW